MRKFYQILGFLILFFPLLLSAQIGVELRTGIGYGFDSNQFREAPVSDEIDFTSYHGSQSFNLRNPYLISSDVIVTYKNIGLRLGHSYQQRDLAPTDLRIRLHALQTGIFYRFNLGNWFSIEPGVFVAVAFSPTSYEEASSTLVINGSIKDVDPSLYHISPTGGEITFIREDFVGSIFGFSLATNFNLTDRLYLGVEGLLQMRKACSSNLTIGCNTQSFHTQPYDEVTNEVTFQLNQHVVDIHSTLFLNLKIGYQISKTES